MSLGSEHVETEYRALESLVEGAARPTASVPVIQASRIRTGRILHRERTREAHLSAQLIELAEHRFLRFFRSLVDVLGCPVTGCRPTMILPIQRGPSWYTLPSLLPRLPRFLRPVAIPLHPSCRDNPVGDHRRRNKRGNNEGSVYQGRASLDRQDHRRPHPVTGQPQRRRVTGKRRKRCSASR